MFNVNGLKITIVMVLLVFPFLGEQIYAQENMSLATSGGLDLSGGVTDYETTILDLELVNTSQTVSKLESVEDAFDYTPYDRLNQRTAAGNYHLGDVNLRIRAIGEDSWIEYSTAYDRATVDVIEPEENILAAADLSNTLSADFPLDIKRYWEKKDDHLVLRFEIDNPTDVDYEIGALGIPMIFNNNLRGKSLNQAHTENVFFDPYIGCDAGYLQVAKLNGKGKVLLVFPWQNSSFEAYRPLLDDPTSTGSDFEGFHEWMIHSKAYAENDWSGAEQWNDPTSKVIEAGTLYQFGVEFVLADSIEGIENALEKYDRPVAVGIPGYVLPQDVKGNLFIKYGEEVERVEIYPADALTLTQSTETETGWNKYEVKGNIWGRCRLTIVYKDSLKQTINYKVIKSESEVVNDNGNFLMTKQWYQNDDDLFDRSPSVITYDYEEQQQVTQDRRVWIAGLSDEGGAGSWLNAIMNQLVAPNPEDVAKLDTFVNETLWGGIQYSSGSRKYAVRRSMFYYDPNNMPAGTYDSNIDYSTWAAWSQSDAKDVWRSYNYPHVAVAYWAMYKLARNYEGLVTQNEWSWYLENAYQTAMAMVQYASYYSQFGQMEGSVFLHILNSLEAEGLTEEAEAMNSAMKSRTLHWSTLNFPFGSEMSWDSTGQEEVYMWTRYYGYDAKALVTLNAILAYMPTVPHWAYNGNARRYWDFLYAGKLSRIERMIHHYGSALNSIPVLYEYRLHPDDLYLLRVGYGGVMGALSNITQDGFAPTAFHSYPSTLKNDGISGDYGSGFYGYATNSSTYVLNSKDFGWVSFGGNVSENDDLVDVEITTAAKSRFFFAEDSLWLTLDAGNFENIRYNKTTKEFEIEFGKGETYMPNAVLNVDDSRFDLGFEGKYNKNSAGAWIIPLSQSSDTTITFTPQRVITNSLHKTELSRVVIYPVPSNDKVNIMVDNRQLTTVYVTDISGKEILRKSFISGISLNRNDLSNSGVYLVRIEQDHKVLHTGRIIIN